MAEPIEVEISGTLNPDFWIKPLRKYYEDLPVLSVFVKEPRLILATGNRGVRGRDEPGFKCWIRLLPTGRPVITLQGKEHAHQLELINLEGEFDIWQPYFMEFYVEKLPDTRKAGMFVHSFFNPDRTTFFNLLAVPSALEYVKSVAEWSPVFFGNLDEVLDIEEVMT